LRPLHVGARGMGVGAVSNWIIDRVQKGEGCASGSPRGGWTRRVPM